MIRRENEMKVEHSENRRGGKGHVYTTHILQGDEFNNNARLFAKTKLPKGSSIGAHYHEGDCEAYYIIKGTAKFSDNGEEVILNSGDVGYIKSGEFHSIENIGEDDLEFIALIIFS